MAATSLHHHPILKLQQHSSPETTTPSSLFLKPTTATTLSISISSSPAISPATATTTSAFSVSSATSITSPSTSTTTVSLESLQQHLSDQDFRQADEETRRLLIVLAGEAAQKRGYVFFSEVQFIPEEDLKAIDGLWRQYSNNRFGYSVQKRIWKQKVDKDFTKFFIKVGWMKLLDTEVVQYNYRAFPNEFVWELNEETPEGHLPLTNALRGTQLLNTILNHPAFEGEEEEDGGVEVAAGSRMGGLKGLLDGSKPLSKGPLKPDYSF